MALSQRVSENKSPKERSHYYKNRLYQYTNKFKLKFQDTTDAYIETYKSPLLKWPFASYLCPPGGFPRKVFNKPVIFLGADVTHPPAGDKKKPSIAAVVGSQDAHPSRYAATVRVQAHRQETIHELSAMVKEHLVMFYKSTRGYKPHRIIIYRDGVSEGQLMYVLQHELTAIREACTMLEPVYTPGYSAVIHKKEKSGKSGNMPISTQIQSDRNNESQLAYLSKNKQLTYQWCLQFNTVRWNLSAKLKTRETPLLLKF